MKTNKKWALKDILILQAVFIVFSLSSVVSKLASAEMASLDSIFNPRFIFLAVLDVVILGIYALLWQQVIKKWELSVAYANKAMTLFWGLLAGALLFHEQITVTKIGGVAVVFMGVVIMNSEKEPPP